MNPKVVRKKFFADATRSVVISISGNELDRAITEFLRSKGHSEENFDKYGCECVAENEWGNYQEHSFDVDAIPTKEPLGSLATGEILNLMCFEGYIEAGEYLVDCSW